MVGCLPSRLKALGLISNTVKKGGGKEGGRGERGRERNMRKRKGRKFSIYKTHVHLNDLLNNGQTVLLPTHVLQRQL